MREIKLRAWHDEKKEMIPPWSIWKTNLTDYEDSCCLHLMQYTGMKDTNGKEIYEGDLVVVNGHYDGDHFHQSYKAPVVSDETGQWWCDETEHGIFAGDSLWEAVVNHHCYVIGNIYEGERK